MCAHSDLDHQDSGGTQLKGYPHYYVLCLRPKHVSGFVPHAMYNGTTRIVPYSSMPQRVDRFNMELAN